MTELSRFSKINDAFVCENCGQEVPAAEKTCRNHCPFCLHSKHVDINPGDRANPCAGLLIPIGYEIHSKKGLMIQFKCKKCREELRTIALTEDKIQPDSYEKILKLTPKK